MASGGEMAQTGCGSGAAVVASAAGGNNGAKQQQQQPQHDHHQHHNQLVVLDGTDITELVGDERAFSSFVDSKFQQLDRDCDGKLSLKELEPAISDIGAALDLPAQGSSPDSDGVYSEVMNEFTHGKQEEITKNEFKIVLSDILLGMADGLRRDPIVILRTDGDVLRQFVDGPGFELEGIAIFSQIESTNAPLHKGIIMAVEQLTVDHGMPPASDAWVSLNIILPSLQSLSSNLLDQTVSQEAFLEEFKKVLHCIAEHLKEHPVIVARIEKTFDGSGIKGLLSDTHELDKLLDMIWKQLPKQSNHRASKEYLRVALDAVAPYAGLPPYGAVDQVDAVVNEAFRMVSADDGKLVHEKNFKMLMREILGSIMLQLQGNPIFFSSNSVVHEPFSSSSTVFPPQLMISAQPRSG